MERLLIYIKHHLPLFWILIDWSNRELFKMMYSHKLKEVSTKALTQSDLHGINFRIIQLTDLPELKNLIELQRPERLAFFHPHDFNEKSLYIVYKNPSFLMMGVFDGPKMLGYFFLRCFCNRKCFVGRLIDEPYEGKGIGKAMNNIMYSIGWQMGFRVYSTISKNNNMVMKSHAHNRAMKIVKELDNDYLLVEFVRNQT